MEDETRNIEETNDQNSPREETRTRKTSRPKRGRGNPNRQTRRNAPARATSAAAPPSSPPPPPPENPDAFEAYKYMLQTSKVPEAEAAVELYEDEFNTKKEIRRNQTAFLLGSEDFQREYLAINFNIAAIMAQDSKEVKANIEGRAGTPELAEVLGFVQMNTNLKDKLVAARQAIIVAKGQLAKIEQEANKIKDSIEDSKNGPEVKIIRRGITNADGKSKFDDAVEDLVEQADQAHDLADDAREKEIIVEGIHAYINVESLLPHATKTEDVVTSFKTDVDNNITFANGEVNSARDTLEVRLVELSRTDNYKDRSELNLASLQETIDNVDNAIPPDEDIQEILTEVESTVDSGADEDNDDA